jgi:hypothetical protein
MAGFRRYFAKASASLGERAQDSLGGVIFDRSLRAATQLVKVWQLPALAQRVK